MRAEVRHGDGHPTVAVGLGRGEALTAEAGTLLTVDSGIAIRRPAEDEDLDAVRKRLSERVPIKLVRFVAESAGRVALAPPLPGDVVRIPTGDRPLFVVQAGSFVAAGDGVTMRSTADTGHTVRGAGLSFLQLTGSGPAFLAAYGSVESHALDRGEELTADVGHVVSFTGVTHDLETVGGLKSAVFEDEGVLAHFVGPGRVWLQTRSHDGYLAWLAPQLETLR